MSKSFYNRNCVVRIGKPGSLGKEYKGFRVSFEVEKSTEKHPNNAKIQVYNLNLDSRSYAQQKGIQLELLAGYGDVLEQVFIGDIDPENSKNEMQDSDIVTHFECGDGQTAFQNTHFEKTYAEGTSSGDIIKDLVGSFKSSVGDLIGLPSDKILNPTTLSGMSQDLMDKVAKKAGLNWSIQDGVLEITEMGKAVPGEAILLNSTTGLIGMPKKSHSTVELTSLLQAKIKPNRLIQLVSADISGLFVAQKVKHKGDTHDREFYTIIEAVKVG